jgi:hypothetical protein
LERTHVSDKGATVEGGQSNQVFTECTQHFDVEKDPVTLEIWMKAPKSSVKAEVAQPAHCGTAAYLGKVDPWVIKVENGNSMNIYRGGKRVYTKELRVMNDNQTLHFETTDFEAVSAARLQDVAVMPTGFIVNTSNFVWR